MTYVFCSRGFSNDTYCKLSLDAQADKAFKLITGEGTREDVFFWFLERNRLTRIASWCSAELEPVDENDVSIVGCRK
jgi:hypothetical protein